MINLIDYFLDSNKNNNKEGMRHSGYPGNYYNWRGRGRKRHQAYLAELRRQKKESEDRLKLLREEKKRNSQLAQLEAQVEILKKKGMEDNKAYTTAIVKLQQAELQLANTTKEMSEETKEINRLKNLIEESEERVNKTAENVVTAAGKAKKASGEAKEAADKAKEEADKTKEEADKTKQSREKVEENVEIIEKAADAAENNTLNSLGDAMYNQNQLDQIQEQSDELNKSKEKATFTNLFEGFLETNINMEPFTGEILLNHNRDLHKNKYKI